MSVDRKMWCKKIHLVLIFEEAQTPIDTSKYNLCSRKWFHTWNKKKLEIILVPIWYSYDKTRRDSNDTQSDSNETRLRLKWDSNKTWMRIKWKSNEIWIRLNWDWNETGMRLEWDSNKIQMKLKWDSNEIWMRLKRDSNETGMKT